MLQKNQLIRDMTEIGLSHADFPRMMARWKSIAGPTIIARWNDVAKYRVAREATVVLILNP